MLRLGTSKRVHRNDILAAQWSLDYKDWTDKVSKRAQGETCSGLVVMVGVTV